MQLDQQLLTEAVLGLFGIVSVIYLVHTGEITGPVALGSIFTILAAFGVVERRRQSGTDQSTDAEADQ